MNRITVTEKGQSLTFTFEDILKYFGSGKISGCVVGVSHGLISMQLAFPMLDAGRPLERREVSVRTAFPGAGARDALEMVTRCFTDGRVVVDKNMPEAKDAVESPGGRYYFEYSYRGRTVACSVKPGWVKPEFIALARVKNRTPEQEAALDAMKRETAQRLLAAQSGDVYEARLVA